MRFVHLCSGLLVRDGALLLTRSVYEGEPDPLWTLPGGRQEKGETKTQTVAREFWEETSLHVRVCELAYGSESIDQPRALHVMNATFHVEQLDLAEQPRAQDPKIVEVRFVPLAHVPALLRADVLRIPVEAALSGKSNGRYFSFNAEDVVEPFFRAPVPARGPG